MEAPPRRTAGVARGRRVRRALPRRPGVHPAPLRGGVERVGAPAPAPRRGRPREDRGGASAARSSSHACARRTRRTESAWRSPPLASRATRPSGRGGRSSTPSPRASAATFSRSPRMPRTTTPPPRSSWATASSRWSSTAPGRRPTRPTRRRRAERRRSPAEPPPSYATRRGSPRSRLHLQRNGLCHDPVQPWSRGLAVASAAGRHPNRTPGQPRSFSSRSIPSPMPVVNFAGNDSRAPLRRAMRSPKGRRQARDRRAVRARGRSKRR